MQKVITETIDQSVYYIDNRVNSERVNSIVLYMTHLATLKQYVVNNFKGVINTYSPNVNNFIKRVTEAGEAIENIDCLSSQLINFTETNPDFVSSSNQPIKAGLYRVGLVDNVTAAQFSTFIMHVLDKNSLTLSENYDDILIGYKNN